MSVLYNKVQSSGLCTHCMIEEEPLTELKSCWLLRQSLLRGVRSSSHSCYERRREARIQPIYSGAGGGGGGWKRRRPMLIVFSHSLTPSIVTESRKSCTGFDSYYVKFSCYYTTLHNCGIHNTFTRFCGTHTH